LNRALLEALEQAYRKPAWHGTNLRGSLRGLTPKQALWRPGPGRHNIWEEVLHAAYWKYAVRKRLLGGKRREFPLEGSNWFPAPESAGPKEWKQAVLLLDQEHDALGAAVVNYPAARLNRRVLRSKWSVFDSTLGTAFHDIYHAGQIQLLKRLQKTVSSR
jgi:hypothetical protein